jgi:hypothetical protein
MREFVMKSVFAAVVCAIGSFAAANVANASIITVNFDGVVYERSVNPVLGIDAPLGAAVHGTLVYSSDSGGSANSPLNGKFSLHIGGHLLEGIDPGVPGFGLKPPKDHQYFLGNENGDPILDGVPVQAYYLFAFLFPNFPEVPGDPKAPGGPKVPPTPLDVNPPALDTWSLFVPSGSRGEIGFGNNDYISFSIDSISVSAVESAPEPATISIWCLGALASAAVAYRRGRKPR